MVAMNRITAEQFRACQHSPDYCVIDVRDQGEYASQAEANSCNWPLNSISAETVAGFVKERGLSPNQTIVLLCTWYVSRYGSGKTGQFVAQPDCGGRGWACCTRACGCAYVD